MNRSRKAQAVGYILIAVVALIAGAALAFGGSNPVESATASTSPVASTPTATQPASPSTTPSTDAPSPSTTIAPPLTQEQIDQAVVDALTVSTSSVNCPDIVVANGGNTLVADGKTVVKFNIGALKGVPPRLWSDAISLPYVGTDPQLMLGETQAAICMDPLNGSTVANFFANMAIGDVKVLDLNSWLQPFAGDATKINAMAAGFIPLLDVTDPTPDQQHAAVAQNDAWRGIAEKVGTLLTKFQLVGVGSEQSVLNYHLQAGGLVVGGLPAVELNSIQEALPALMLDLTVKAAPCGPIKRIGFNVGDKRPEEFALPVCVPTPTTTVVVTTTPPTVPPTTPVVTTPPTVPTTPPATTPQPVPTSTSIPCPSGKCVPPVTLAPQPVTIPPDTTTVTQPPGSPTTVQAGNGATNTSVPPSTVAPPATPPAAPPVSGPPPKV